MTVDLKRFAPGKDATITVTRKLTALERKTKQLHDLTSYVVNELFYLHNYKQLDRVMIKRHGVVYEFAFVSSQVNIVNMSWLCDGIVIWNGNSEDLKNALIKRFDICDIARLLKRAYKQVNDKFALRGNKPQPKVVKQKVVKSSELELFAKEFKKLSAKYPNITVYCDRDGIPMAYMHDTFDSFRTVSIRL